MPSDLQQCPACGGKLLQESARACPYCSHELGGGGPEEGANTARLRRMREHDQFSGAMEWSPTGDEVRAASRRLVQGVVLVALGLVLVLVTWGDWNFFLIGFGLVALVEGARRIVSGRRTHAAFAAHQLCRRPAMVTDRRSETAFNGWSGRVTYFFTIEFDDGLSGEFRFPGRGWPHEPLARGATGVAYTRGAELVEFKHIKV